MPELCLPRYHFAAGQELTYEGSVLTRDLDWHIQSDHGQSIWDTHARVRCVSERKRTLTVWVLEVFQDGSADLLIHFQVYDVDEGMPSSTFLMTRLSVEGKRLQIMEGSPAVLSSRTIALFPMLPETIEQAYSGWKEEDEKYEESYNWWVQDDYSKLLPYESKNNLSCFQWDEYLLHCSIEIENIGSPTNPFPKSTRLYFDKELGLPVRLESDFVDEKSHSIEVMRLEAVENRDDVWLTDMKLQYMGVLEYVKEFASIQRHSGINIRLYEKEYASWKERYDNYLKDGQFNEYAKSYIESYSHRSVHFHDRAMGKLRSDMRFLDKPSPDWQAFDMDGKTHKLSDYRGKYVFLDFWNSSNGLEVFHLQDVNSLVTHYCNMPFVVLGITHDEDMNTVFDIVRDKQLAFPTFYGPGVAGIYLCDVGRNWVLIDPEGIVRYIGQTGGIERMKAILNFYLEGNVQGE